MKTISCEHAYCLDAVGLVRLRAYLRWVELTLDDESRCADDDD